MAVRKVIGDWLSSIWDRIGAPAGASISADISAIDSKADDIINFTTKRAIGNMNAFKTTIDLNNVAGTYDLFTGDSEDVLVERLVIITPNSAAGGALTSISIQTNDATAITFIDNVTGAVANLTAEAQLASNAPIIVAVGKKVQLTINGGATGVGYVCTVYAIGRAMADGGQLV